LKDCRFFVAGDEHAFTDKQKTAYCPQRV
jgi:hypothetical protein